MLYFYSAVVDVYHSTIPLELEINGIDFRPRETKLKSVRNCREFETTEFEIVDPGKYY